MVGPRRSSSRGPPRPGPRRRSFNSPDEDPSPHRRARLLVQDAGRCIFSDDMDGVMAAMKAADALVLATPVYVDGMTGLMKNCIDRMVPVADPHFEMRDGAAVTRGEAAPASAGWRSSRPADFELENFDPLPRT